MIVLVCGGRDFGDRQFVYDTLDELDQREEITCIVHGGATGADAHADGWAMSRGRVATRYPVQDWEWRSHGKRAGAMRNQRMLDEGKPDMVVAFPGGRGTADMVRRAKRAGVSVVEPRKGQLELGLDSSFEIDPDVPEEHTSHCEARMRWGDGECECKRK